MPVGSVGSSWVGGRSTWCVPVVGIFGRSGFGWRERLKKAFVCREKMWFFGSGLLLTPKCV
jgi:hypothetical protein